MAFPGASPKGLSIATLGCALLALSLSGRAAALKDTPSLRSGDTPISELPAIGIELTTDRFRVGKPFDLTLRLPPACKKVSLTLPGSKVYAPTSSRWVQDRGLVFTFQPLAPGTIALREFRISCPGWAGRFTPLRIQVKGTGGPPGL